MSWLGDIFGGGAKAAQGDIIAGSNAAGGYLNTGQNQALANYGQGWGLFQGYMNPYIQGGQTGYNAYQSALGLNGADAQNAVSSAYLNSPIQQQIRALTQQGINRSYAPTGQGGAALQATTNALLGNWNNYLGQLQGNAQMGQQAGMYGAQGGMQYGSDLANTNAGFAQLQANRLMGQGNALANIKMANSAQGMNFLGGLIGATGKALSGPMGGSMANGASSLFSSIGDMFA